VAQPIDLASTTNTEVIMRTVDLSEPELIAFSGEHLLYELQLLLFTGRELGRQPTPVMRSVLIESFVIHLRNLIDFFYTPRAKEDDVIAADFCPRWNETISNTLKIAKERANKELSHLTLGRKNGLDPSKPWDVRALFQEVHDVATTFARKASSAKLSAEVPKWLGMVRANTITVLGGMVTTNTVSSVVIS
jgi:hypothetical protein